MRALLQRVTGASVEADRQVIGSIDRGLVTLLGVAAWIFRTGYRLKS